jgi:hypothetical protein
MLNNMCGPKFVTCLVLQPRQCVTLEYHKAGNKTLKPCTTSVRCLVKSHS